MNSFKNTSDSSFSSNLINPSSNTTRSKLGRTPKKVQGDRFIPVRSAMDIEIANYHLTKENKDPFSNENNEKLAQALFGTKLNAKILSFQSKAPSSRNHSNPNSVLFSSNLAAKKNTNRAIPQTPMKILDAPNFQDDYYLNVLDWSSQNVIAVGLSDTAYTLDFSTGVAAPIMTTSDTTITSVGWGNDGVHLAIGLDTGIVELWDAQEQKCLRSLPGNQRRVACLAWNGPILSTGSKSGKISNHDVRIRDSLISVFDGHSQEVCGLKWNADGTTLASGGNDNLVNLWNMSQSSPKMTMSDHTAAVKAIAWCPWQKDLLATGGGSSDRSIKFWNTTSGACINTIDTGSQVSQLAWSKIEGCKEIVSTHGYAKNHLAVWKFPSLNQVAELTGHTHRILCMAQSPDGTKVVTGSADETFCFWDVFPESVAKSTKSASKPDRSVNAHVMRIR
eukprot:TRINITY_DN1887_c0_g1_i3.p1 TRINITY_DN1887_c0_g1~~TRINITY_DN1887_c0_g1_i3.p1  ORF type:complete len:448 (+),score=128.06 TRINITY_DN1887_c0_g1_i3:66-1409(+)